MPVNSKYETDTAATRGVKFGRGRGNPRGGGRSRQQHRRREVVGFKEINATLARSGRNKELFKAAFGPYSSLQRLEGRHERLVELESDGTWCIRKLRNPPTTYHRASLGEHILDNYGGQWRVRRFGEDNDTPIDPEIQATFAQQLISGPWIVRRTYPNFPDGNSLTFRPYYKGEEMAEGIQVEDLCFGPVSKEKEDEDKKEQDMITITILAFLYEQAKTRNVNHQSNQVTPTTDPQDADQASTTKNWREKLMQRPGTRVRKTLTAAKEVFFFTCLLVYLLTASNYLSTANATIIKDASPAGLPLKAAKDAHAVLFSDINPNYHVPLPAVSREERELNAYDCSEPQNITAVSLMDYTEIRSCQEEQLKQQQQQVEYLLVQKAEQIPMNVLQCKVTASRLVFACGAASHSAISSRESYFNKPMFINKEDCAKIWKKKEYCVKSWDSRYGTWQCGALQENTANFLSLPRTGYSYNGMTDILCKGGTFPKEELISLRDDQKSKYWHEDLTSMIVHDYITVELFRQEAAILHNDQNGHETILVRRPQVELHCSPSAHKDGCETHNFGTFVWPHYQETEKCPYFKIRKVTGINLDHVRSLDGGEEAGETFLSNNETMIRLKKKGRTISGCSAVLQPTEFDQLFLTEDLDHPLLNRQLDPREVSAFLHATVSDVYIYEKSQDQLAEAVLGLQRHQCRQERTRNIKAWATRLARQKAVADGDTAHLGEGVFLTASGDLAYMYRCRPIVVSAIPHPDQCYNALPIQLSTPDAQHLKKIIGGPQQDLQELPPFFLEPRSHRIVPVAAPMACVPHLAPTYRTRKGKWLKLTDVGILPAEGPKREDELPPELFEIERSSLPGENDRSIYPAAIIKQTLKFLTAPALILSGPLRQAKKMQDQYDASAIPGDSNGSFFHLNDLGSGLPDASDLLGMGGVIKFFKAYGTVCTILIGTYLAYSFLLYFIGVWIRLFFYPKHLPYPIHIIMAFFPELTKLLCFGQYDPDGPRGPCHQIVASCVDSHNRHKDQEKPFTRAEVTYHKEPVPDLDKFAQRNATAAKPPLYPELTRDQLVQRFNNENNTPEEKDEARKLLISHDIAEAQQELAMASIHLPRAQRGLAMATIQEENYQGAGAVDQNDDDCYTPPNSSVETIVRP